jgi:hypothetical protein
MIGSALFLTGPSSIASFIVCLTPASSTVRFRCQPCSGREDLFSARAPSTEGPFLHEVRTFGSAPYRTDIDIDAAKGLLELGPKMGVDFSFSDEFRIDHAFTVPLNFIRPAMDLPIPSREHPR